MKLIITDPDHPQNIIYLILMCFTRSFIVSVRVCATCKWAAAQMAFCYLMQDHKISYK